MKNNKKNFAAAVLAAMCLSGCAARYETYSAPPANPATSFDLFGSSSEAAVSSEPAVSSDSSELSYPDIVNSSGSDDSAAASTQSETEWPDIVCTVDWDDINNNSKSDDKSIGFKSPRTEEEKLVDALIDELKLNDNKKSDMEKLCILGKWFSENTEYDHELEATGNYGLETKASYLLTKHSGVCATYAETACLILSKCGIDTLVCDNGNINHAWNAVKIDGQWTYTDFTGGPDTLILGSSRHGLPKHTIIYSHLSLNGYGYSGAKPDISEISSDLRLYDFNGKELQVHKEADGFSYVESNGNSRKTVF